MKTKHVLFIIFIFSALKITAQIKPIQYKPFTKGLELKNASGPGIKNASGDILLELVSNEQDEGETLLIIRNTKGKLTKISSNDQLLMNQDILGISGSNYPSFDDKIISIDYTLGSNSATSDISFKFEKGNDANYWFKEYTSISKNFGVENLFARQLITAKQTGKINFSEASEDLILKKSNAKTAIETNEDAVYKAASTYSKYIPEGFRLGAFATGDLNLDTQKKDLLLLIYNETECKIQILLQQSNGKYKVDVENDHLIVPDENFNVNNLKLIIKNGFFTVEQRTAADDLLFYHHYLTFKYDKIKSNFILFRYDVEAYSGFNLNPNAEVQHTIQKDFGTILFQKVNFP